MNDLVDVMIGLGMAFDSNEPHFPWEEFDKLHSDPNHYNEAGVPISSRAKLLDEHVREVRPAHLEFGTPGIPAHKLLGLGEPRLACHQARVPAGHLGIRRVHGRARPSS